MSTNKHEPEHDDLTRETLALPRELEAPRDLWRGIEARIARKRQRTLVVRRSMTGASILLAAAVVVLAIRSPKHLRGDAPAPTQSEARLVLPAPPVPVPPAPRVMDDPAATVFPEEATYRAALAALAPSFEARKKTLPGKDVAAVSVSLRAIDAAILVTRGSLADSPDDDDLRGELDAEYEQEIDTMNDVLEWTTRS